MRSPWRSRAWLECSVLALTFVLSTLPSRARAQALPGDSSDSPVGASKPATDSKEPSADETESALDKARSALESTDSYIDSGPQPYRPGEPVDPVRADVDPYGDPRDVAPREQISAQVRYVLERIDVVGNSRTHSSVLRKFVPLTAGEFLDPESPEIEAIEWKLMGTGWFRSVDLRLERGSRRGYVILVVDVVERNTIVIEQLVAGLYEGLEGSTDQNLDLSPYVGFKVSDTNFLGRGMKLSGTALLSQLQQGGRLDLRYPKLIKRQFALRFGTFFLNGREFYGNEPLVSVPCSEPACPGTSDVKNAVVRYRRGGFLIGTGRDITASLRYTIDWGGDIVSVLNRPDAAAEIRGDEVTPIDFAIDDGRSFVSLLRFGLVYDKRNDPGITTEGVLFRGVVTAGSRFLGSDYDFLQLEAWVRRWWRLPWNHTLRLGAFAGAAVGETPFFYLFHVSDLTDLIPSRFLEMQLDRRAPPNLLGTSIESIRLGELAWRLDLGYELPIFDKERAHGLRRVTLYSLVGLYSLADLRDPRAGISGYTGAARYPIDLTFDVGFRFDTRVGVFTVGFSTLLGFIHL